MPLRLPLGSTSVEPTLNRGSSPPHLPNAASFSLLSHNIISQRRVTAIFDDRLDASTRPPSPPGSRAATTPQRPREADPNPSSLWMSTPVFSARLPCGSRRKPTVLLNIKHSSQHLDDNRSGSHRSVNILSWPLHHAKDDDFRIVERRKRLKR